MFNDAQKFNDALDTVIKHETRVHTHKIVADFNFTVLCGIILKTALIKSRVYTCTVMIGPLQCHLDVPRRQYNKMGECALDGHIHVAHFGQRFSSLGLGPSLRSLLKG